MPGADSYPEGTTALATDSEQRSLVKICSLIAAGAGGGGAGGDTDWSSFSGAYGAGNPPTETPTTARGVGYNTSDGGVHYWWGSAWH